MCTICGHFAKDSKITSNDIYDMLKKMEHRVPGDYFAGHSAVFDPRGDTLASAKIKPRILKATIDLDEVKAWRKEERIYRNRRPRLYRNITSHKNEA